MADRILNLPLQAEELLSLRCGDGVLLRGPMFTGRDAAHKRLCGLLDEGKPLPISLTGESIYYVGPAPAKPGYAIGPAGPTTSYRMDPYTPKLLAAGLRLMIGKGMRGPEVIEAMKRFGAVYLGATGGAAALIARSITRCELVAYPDLGTEAIHRLEVYDFPAIVLIDSRGQNLYEDGPLRYRREG